MNQDKSPFLQVNNLSHFVAMENQHVVHQTGGHCDRHLHGYMKALSYSSPASIQHILITMGSMVGKVESWLRTIRKHVLSHEACPYPYPGGLSPAAAAADG